MKHIIILLIFCTVGSITAQSQEKVNTERISIFTDGNSYIEKTIRLTPENDKYILYDKLFPRARFGTLSITDSEKSIKSIKSYVDTVNTQKLLKSKVTFQASFDDFLKANIKKQVTLEIGDKIIKGELSELYNNYSQITHMLIKEDDKYTLIKVNDIKDIKFNSEPNIPTGRAVNQKMYYQGNQTNQYINLLLLLEFNNSLPKVINMRYLQKGFLWNPFYFMELNEHKKEAVLRLNAEVVNDAEDFNHTDLYLYVGEPNFQYSDYLADLADFNNLMDPNYDIQRKTNYESLSTSVVTGYGSSYSRNNFKKEADRKVQSFYVYELKNKSLEKRSRGLYKLFESVVKYEHVYVCNIKDTKNYRNDESEKVFQCIRFKNNLNKLLGAGPVTILDNTKNRYSPIAQSRLNYTPQNEDVIIQLTETFDIQINQYVVKSKIKDEFIKVGNNNFKKTKNTLTTQIVNYKNEEVNIVIKQELEGEVSEAPNLKIINSKDYFQTLNKKNFLEWNITLKPNEKKEIKYDFYYYTYINSNN